MHEHEQTKLYCPTACTQTGCQKNTEAPSTHIHAHSCSLTHLLTVRTLSSTRNCRMNPPLCSIALCIILRATESVCKSFSLWKCKADRPTKRTVTRFSSASQPS